MIMAITASVASSAGELPESPQSRYLKASALIRDGDYVGARGLLEKILLDCADSDIALLADQRLSDISAMAQDQERQRLFAAGPGLYVFWNDGRCEHLPAFLMTENDVGAEAHDPDLGVMRCLSERTSYAPLVLTDVKRLVVFMAECDPAAYRLEQVTSWFPYHLARDIGPLPSVAEERGLLSVDPAALAAIPPDEDGSRKRRGGISVARHLAPGATLVSQQVGTWGREPGPARWAIWTMDIVVDHREELMIAATGNAAVDVVAAQRAANAHPDDPSIDLWIAEIAAETGDRAAFAEAVAAYESKARARSDARHMVSAGKLAALAGAVVILEQYVNTRKSLVSSPELIAELSRFATDLSLPVASYLLSCVLADAGDLDAAVASARAAEKAARDTQPRLWHCGVVPVVGSSREAARAARALYGAQLKALEGRRRALRRGADSGRDR